MNNTSLMGEDITLCAGKNYYVIDALYLNDVKVGLSDLQKDKTDEKIAREIFPYTTAPFAKILMHRDSFQVHSIIKVRHEDLLPDGGNCFSSDTGLVLLIEQSHLISFVKAYNYDDLVDSHIEDINLGYWNNITSGINRNEIGLILAPGMGSGYEFEGSGLYKINL
jgi:hypothetical protein